MTARCVASLTTHSKAALPRPGVGKGWGSTGEKGIKMGSS